jgi:hypothetical protein
VRARLFLAITGLVLTAPAISAERWREYTYPDDGFSASFPGKPVFAERLYRTSQSPTGAVPERIYSYNKGGVIYSVSITDFSKVDADPDIVVDEVASVLMGLGTLAFYDSIYLDSMHGRELVVIGGDGSRYTDANFYVKQLLYQVKVVYPAVNSDPAGSSGISIFLTQFHFTNPF